MRLPARMHPILAAIGLVVALALFLSDHGLIYAL